MRGGQGPRETSNRSPRPEVDDYEEDPEHPDEYTDPDEEENTDEPHSPSLGERLRALGSRLMPELRLSPISFRKATTVKPENSTKMDSGATGKGGTDVTGKSVRGNHPTPEEETDQREPTTESIELATDNPSTVK